MVTPLGINDVFFTYEYFVVQSDIKAIGMTVKFIVVEFDLTAFKEYLSVPESFIAARQFWQVSSRIWALVSTQAIEIIGEGATAIYDNTSQLRCRIYNQREEPKMPGIALPPLKHNHNVERRQRCRELHQQALASMAYLIESSSDQSSISLREEHMPNHDSISTHRHEPDQRCVSTLKCMSLQAPANAQQEAKWPTSHPNDARSTPNSKSAMFLIHQLDCYHWSRACTNPTSIGQPPSSICSPSGSAEIEGIGIVQQGSTWWMFARRCFFRIPSNRVIGEAFDWQKIDSWGFKRG